MAVKPLDPWLFRLEGDVPVLLGSRCLSCGESFFPRRRLCPICSEATEAVELPGRGALYSHTYVHVPSTTWGRAHAAGYGVGEIDLPDGPRIQAVLTGEPAQWEIGAPMQIGVE